MAAGRCRTSMSPTGWTAEFRIPLRTLRYGPAPQTWGVNFFRNIQRTRERTYWAPLPRVYNLGRLSSAGELRGLAAPDAAQFQAAAVRRRLGEPEFLTGTPKPTGRRFRLRRQVRGHAQLEPRPDLQHRLRPGRGRHAADQPLALQSAISREAAVLPGELRSVHDRQGQTSSICSSAAASASTRTACSCRSAGAAA